MARPGLLVASLWLAGLVGCAHRPPPDLPAASWATQRASLMALTEFHFNGRLAVASGEEGFSGGIDWRQQAGLSALQLRGPLGVALAQVQFDGHTLDLRLGDGSELRGQAAEAALAQSLGFHAPLASLAYWLRGCDDPASPADITLDEQNRLAALQQQGWQISYDSYQRQGTLWLPQRLTLRREPVRLRLMIQSWNLPG